MGIGPFSRSSSNYSNEYVPPTYTTNPNPRNYKIIRYKEKDGNSLVEINYPNCTNYEGNKILFYRCTMVELLLQKEIDPHFSENKTFKSPFARFEPTANGWNAGLKMLEYLDV